MTLAEFIIEYRKEHDLSQRSMAAKCSLSTGYISLIEKEINPQTGKRMIPTLPVLNKLASGMGLTIDELIASCDDMPVNIMNWEGQRLNKKQQKELLKILDAELEARRQSGAFAVVRSGVKIDFFPRLRAGRLMPSDWENVLIVADYLGVKDKALSVLDSPDLLDEKEKDPAEPKFDGASLDEELISRLCQLSPEELEKVDAFVQGILAAR